MIFWVGCAALTFHFASPTWALIPTFFTGFWLAESRRRAKGREGVGVAYDELGSEAVVSTRWYPFDGGDASQVYCTEGTFHGLVVVAYREQYEVDARRRHKEVVAALERKASTA